MRALVRAVWAASWAALWAALAGAGCASADVVNLEPLVPPVDAVSVIFAYREGSTLAIEARSISTTPIRWSRENVKAGAGASITALFYRRTLSDLGLLPGALLPASGESSRPLPAFDSGVAAQIDDPATGWAPISALDEALARFRFPSVDRVLFCAEVSGCLGAPNEEATCLDPCPTPTAPIAPESPSPPNFGDCPPGWHPDATGTAGNTGAASACDPWPATGHGVCELRATHHLPGTAGCLPVGRACDAASEWPQDLPSPSTRTIAYVKAGASPSGDGTRANPFPSIGAALAVVPTGAFVAVAKGEYAEAVFIDRDVEIRGACAAETVIRAVGEDVIVRVYGEGGSVERVTIEDISLEGKGHGFVVERGPRPLSLALRGVSIERPTGHGIRIVGATAELDDVRILGAGATSLMLESTIAEIRDLSISEGAWDGLDVATSSVSIERMLMEDVGAAALKTRDDVRLHLREVYASETGSWSFDSGDYLVEDGWFERTPPVRDVTTGLANLKLHRVRLTGFTTYVATGAQLEAQDVVVESSGGMGFEGEGAIDRVAVRDTTESGIWLGSDGAVVANDLEIDTVSSSNPVGVRTAVESRISGARWKISMASGVAAYLRDQSRLTDLTLEGTSSDPFDLAISGVRAYGRTTIERVQVRRVGGPALIVLETGDVMVSDVDIQGGRGAVLARNGAALNVERFNISGVQGPALMIDPTKDDMFGTTRIFARDGLIAECQIGAQLPIHDRIVDVFDHVQYQDVQQNFLYQ